MDKRNLKDQIIILRRFAINENDLLITAFGKLNGKITIKAKGAKKINSKFSGKLEPLGVLHAEIYSSGKSLTLTTISELQPAPKTENLNNFYATQEICKILLSTLPQEEPNKQVFQELIETNRLLQKNSKEQLVLIGFIIKYLQTSGHLSDPKICSNCNEKIEEASIDTFANLICQNCSTNNLNKITLDLLKIINFIYSNNLRETRKLKIDAKTQNNLLKKLNQMSKLAFEN